MSKPAQITLVTQVAPAIYQVRLPLPFALNSVNCYLLADEQGWTILDTGLGTSLGRAGWQEAFQSLGIAPQDVRQIVLTHGHPDHYGMSGWLQQRSPQAPVLMTRETDWFSRYVWREPTRWQGEMRAYLTRSGLPPEMEAKILADMAVMRQRVQPPPEQVILLEPGQILAMGGRRFRAIKAEGHSDDQMIFHDPESRLLLAGDQVLMRITPNIGLWPGTRPQPLARYLASLQELARLEVDLALPGHGRLIQDLAGRIQELEEHHRRRLAEMFQAVAPEGSSAYQVSRRVFPYENFSTHEIRFAVAETLAHLEHLLAAGVLERRTEAGRWIYRSA